jgi:hypothetical protein
MNDQILNGYMTLLPGLFIIIALTDFIFKKSWQGDEHRQLLARS